MRTRQATGILTAVVMLIVLGLAASAAAQATATIAGTVKDAQGGIIPGATVTLISETRGTTFDTVSGATGDFVMSNVPGDTYTVRVSMDGFKTTERKGIAATIGDRVAIGTITIEVGTLAETVLVTGDAPVIQAQTGDRSFTVSKEAVENLPMAGRNFASFATLLPGISGTTRLDGARTNYMLDGISSVNTGGNQQGIQLNPDSIAEVKVIASAYQAEYGRTSGLQISGVTKSGTNQFHGSIYDLDRDSDWNSNSWANVRNGEAKTLNKQRDWGYTLGGPVGKPGGKNNLFFFYSEQFQPREAGGAVNQFRVPSLLEREGDFSKTTDQSGAPFPYIRDTSTGLPCGATTGTAGCFQDNGVIGKIPQDKLYGLGLNILKSYPLPNTEGLNYNLQTISPTVNSSTFQHVIRVDYQASSKLRISSKYAGQNATVQTNPGSLPGYNDTVFQFPAILVPSATVDYTLNPTTVLEGTWGLTQGNQLGNVINSKYTDPANTNLLNFPRIYPNAGIVPVGSYQEKVLRTMNAPFYQNGRAVLVPAFNNWGNRITNAPPALSYPSFLCMQNTKDLFVSLTKLMGSHTVKAGYQSQDSLKLQQLGTITAGALPFEGRISFANDANNPLDTGFGYANAAIGVFTSFSQQNALYEGRYVYHNKDFYIQDNWKMTHKLTLDVGMRFTHHGPQYDVYEQASNFFPEQWSLNNAPYLYTPGCSTSGATCPAANRVAFNPVTQTSLGPNTSAAIGTIVPNTGIITNGIIQAGHGIVKENYKENPMVYGPRMGAAYDLTGTQKMVLRGSVGLFYDRLQGDSIFGQIGNPPVGGSATIVNSTLQQVAAGSTALIGAPTLLIYHYDAKIGSSLNWNVGTQMALPWSSSLDVSYVGSYNYNSVSFGSISVPSTGSAMDLNAPDIGAAYLPQNQDPTITPTSVQGSGAVSTDLMRPYRGLGPIIATWPRFHNRYDSMQFAYNRRFSHGWQAGGNWTLGIRNVGDTVAPLHLQHNADGSIGLRPEQDQVNEILNNVGVRRHLVKANFIWDLPDVKGESTAMKVLAGAANGWQVSGVFTGGSGSQYDATFSYQGITSVNLTGSPNYNARIKVIGDPGKGCSSNQYKQFDPAAYAGPQYGSLGIESGVNLLTGCPDHTTDLAIARNVGLGGARELQFRLDLFNAFNTVVFNARQTNIQYGSPSDQAIRNSQYNADGTLDSKRLLPKTASSGVGAVTGAQALRTVQAQIRFKF